MLSYHNERGLPPLVPCVALRDDDARGGLARFSYICNIIHPLRQIRGCFGPLSQARKGDVDFTELAERVEYDICGFVRLGVGAAAWILITAFR